MSRSHAFRPLTVGVLALGAVAFAQTLGEFAPGDTMPAYVIRNGAGSRADVRADASHDGAAWTVTFLRSLQTGDGASDVQFGPGQTVSFQVATFDNTGETGHDTTQADTSFDMTIPATPGPLSFSGTPAQLAVIAGDYLDSDEVRITMSWFDATKNDRRKEWSFDGTTWSKSTDNEDRIAITWDMQGDQFASAGNCLASCHVPYMYTNPGTKVDTWHWKATRTGPAGRADDKYWDDGAGGTASGRHSDPGQSTYSDNDDGSKPAFMGEEGNGANATALLSFAAAMKEAVAFNPVGVWQNGDRLGGYVQRFGSGSRCDTRTTATHDGLNWTVQFRRKLDTGDPAHDLTFAPGGTYAYQVAKFDNVGGAAHDVTEEHVIHTMTLPLVPGPISFSGTPAQLFAISGDLLSSDELTITATWTDASRDDAREAWTFDGVTWSQSSENEDRLSIIWDMQGDQFASAGTCASMCHWPKMRTKPGTFVDVWHWKASRTGPAGFTDDKWWDDGSADAGDGRHSDSGTSVYQENASNGQPAFMAAGGPGVSADHLFDAGAVTDWSRATPYLEASNEVALTAIDSDSIRLNGNNYADNRLRAYWNTQTGFVDGFIKFDLSSIPDGSTITSMTLRTYHEAYFGNPNGDPKVRLYRVDDDSWSRATVDPHPGVDQPLTDLVADFSSADLEPVDWTIDVSAAVWQPDLQDDTLTIAMRNVNFVDGGYVYFYGSDLVPAPPVLTVAYEACPGSGSITTYGAGCPGSGGFVPKLVGGGCATPGETITLAIEDGYGGASAQLFLGLQAIQVPAGFGCDLLVNPPIYLVTLPLLGQGAGEGSISIPATIPASFPTPVTVYLQAFTTDPGGAGGFTATNGLQLVIDD